MQDPDGPTAGDVGISVVVETRREIEDLTGVKEPVPGRVILKGENYDNAGTIYRKPREAL